ARVNTQLTSLSRVGPERRLTLSDFRLTKRGSGRWLTGPTPWATAAGASKPSTRPQSAITTPTGASVRLDLFMGYPHSSHRPLSLGLIPVYPVNAGNIAAAVLSFKKRSARELRKVRKQAELQRPDPCPRRNRSLSLPGGCRKASRPACANCST